MAIIIQITIIQYNSNNMNNNINKIIIIKEILIEIDIFIKLMIILYHKDGKNNKHYHNIYED